MQPMVQLSIPQPCHEDWHQMTPSEKGRFCSACAKEVVDFTSMSDTEVLYYFLNNKNEKVCGRAYPDQLNRPVTKPVYPQKKKWWYWNYAAMFVMLSAKPGSSKAQGEVKAKINAAAPSINNKADKQLSNTPVTATASRVLVGKVTDEEGEAVPFASLRIKGTMIGLSADAEGSFSIKIKTENDILEISAAGYVAQEIAITNQKELAVTLTKSKNTLEGDVVITVGGIASEYNSPAIKHIAVIEVLDNATYQPVKATVTVVKNGYVENAPVATDAKGVYKLKRIREDDSYQVTVNADGYLPVTMDVKGWLFDERKEIRYVFLEKAPVPGDFKNMEAVTVTSYATQGKICRTLGTVCYGVTIKRTYSDTLNQLKTKLAGSLKIAPNPVQKGSAFRLMYVVKDAGTYLIQITDAAGLLVQQQQVTLTEKTGSVQIQTAASWSSGVYYLRLGDAKNKLLSTNSFIVQ